MNTKQRMLSGEKIYGTMIRISENPAIAYVAKNAGYDFVMYDCEHSSYSMETLTRLFMMGNALDLTSLLRVPNLSKEYISRSLDSGAQGLMVPMVSTEEEALELVKYSKYMPIGDRGFGTGLAHTNFKGGKHSDVMEEANNKIISIAQIETKEAVDNADKLASIEGIDALLIGPNDLSLSLGIPGDLMNPIELEAIKTVANACKKYGKGFGLHAPLPLIKYFIDDLTIVMHDVDTSVIERGFKQNIDACKAL